MTETPPRELLRGTILDLKNLTVSFDGFKALDALTLQIDAGELRCIIGPNGAGKTTMMDVVTGKTRPDQGSAIFAQDIDLLELSERREPPP
jgi:urea transport system ATP-binding protein